MTLGRIPDGVASKRRIAKIEGPHAWNRRDYDDTASFARELTGTQCRALLNALQQVKQQRIAPEAMHRTQFCVPELQTFFHEVSMTLQRGAGFALIRGLPLDDMPDEDCKLLFWGIGMQLGIPVNQSGKLEWLAEVRDVGEKVGDPTARAFRSPGALRFHTDHCDVLALMCVRGALEGGHSRIVSSATVHNVLLDRAPDVLARLYEPFCFSRQGEEVAGDLPYYTCPVFAQEAGFFSSVFSRTFIENAQKLSGVPALESAQWEALDALAQTADEQSITVVLERGDMQFFNNHTIYHARTDYRDHAEQDLKRTLLRLWLTVPHGMPLPDPIRVNFGDSASGLPRGGIMHESGRRFAFEDWRAAGWTQEELTRWKESAHT